MVGCCYCAMAQSLDRELLIVGSEHRYCEAEREVGYKKIAYWVQVQLIPSSWYWVWSNRVNEDQSPYGLISKQLIINCIFCLRTDDQFSLTLKKEKFDPFAYVFKATYATHTNDFQSCRIVVGFPATHSRSDLDHRQVKIFNLLNIFWAEGNRQVN